MSNSAIKTLITGIRERVNEEAICFIDAGSVDDLTWDIEKLIEDYREEVLYSVSSSRTAG
jgi:hypothetical protein